MLWIKNFGEQKQEVAERFNFSSVLSKKINSDDNTGTGNIHIKDLKLWALYATMDCLSEVPQLASRYIEFN